MVRKQKEILEKHDQNQDPDAKPMMQSNLITQSQK